MGSPLWCCLTHHDRCNTTELSLEGAPPLVCAPSVQELLAVLCERPRTSLVEERREGERREEGGREEGGRVHCQWS